MPGFPPGEPRDGFVNGCSTDCRAAPDGKFVFDALTYDLSDAGVHRYRVTERVPDGAGTDGDGFRVKNHIRYSPAVWLVTVTVKDNGNGTLSTAGTMRNLAGSESGETILFRNKYDPPEPPPTVTPEPFYHYLHFTKIWIGTPMDHIDYTVYYPDGSTRRNRFRRTKISETEWLYEAWVRDEGEYYIIEDPIPGYQTRVENIGDHADITDVCYDGGKIINWNVPKTGDPASPLMWLGLAIAGTAGLGITAFLFRRKKKTNRKK